MTELKVLVLSFHDFGNISIASQTFWLLCKALSYTCIFGGHLICINRVPNIKRKDARNLLLRNRMELCLLLGVKSFLLLKNRGKI